jgi:hypothetical protein
MADDPKRIPLSEIRTENGAHDLATTPDMMLYLEVIKAEMQDTAPFQPRTRNI